MLYTLCSLSGTEVLKSSHRTYIRECSRGDTNGSCTLLQRKKERLVGISVMELFK